MVALSIVANGLLELQSFSTQDHVHFEVAAHIGIPYEPHQINMEGFTYDDVVGCCPQDLPVTDISLALSMRSKRYDVQVQHPLHSITVSLQALYFIRNIKGYHEKMIH